LSSASPTKTTDFSLARPRGVCAATNEPIQPDEHFVTALRETPLGFERLDIKLSAWDAYDRTDIVAFWKMTMPKAEAKRKLLVDDNVLCDLLERLQDVESVEKQCFRFVLALILMRKRLVIYENTRVENDKEIWTMRLKGKEQSFDLIDPKPTDEQIAAVKDQFGQILSEEG
jgi:hypothetical protein